MNPCGWWGQIGFLQGADRNAMRGLIRMFDHTRMIVLLSLTAGLYTSLLIPFKAFVIVPGLTEIRPGSVIPVVCSLFFGPAAAWGAAFGNLIGDFFGMFGPASLFGMVGNFLFGYIPYRTWMQGGASSSLELRTGRDMTRYAVGAIAASMACGVTIAWGVDLLGFVPFVVLSNVIVINNLLVTLILGPILMRLLTPRLTAWGLLYQRIMKDGVRPSPRIIHVAGLLLIYGGALSALVVANLHAFVGPTFLDDPLRWTVFGRQMSLHLGATPGFVLVLVGSLLI